MPQGVIRQNGYTPRLSRSPNEKTSKEKHKATKKAQNKMNKTTPKSKSTTVISNFSVEKPKLKIK